ncbi:MAG TPA: Uma2 family endonuclease [Bryobacteraceae bacterium]|nr:Uma2 family endonuclease [Bryobacteraceae bacterium]
MGAVRTLLTFQEFEMLPDHTGKQELLRGELIEAPPSKLKHDEIRSRLYDVLKPALAGLQARGEALQLGRARMVVGYKLGTHSWLIPDVSITHAEQPAGDYLEGAPALAVEVISESNTALEIACKIKELFASGGREVWLIYPDQRSVWVYQPGGQAQEHSDRFTTDLLPGIEIDLDAILGE